MQVADRAERGCIDGDDNRWFGPMEDSLGRD
jgi:hypothetical protein